MAVIRRECPEHGPDVGRPGMVDVILGKCWYCKRELVDVEYVPASQLRGAVAALERIRDHGLTHDEPCHALHKGDCADAMQEIARSTLAYIGGQ